jgi:hypothetical protein
VNLELGALDGFDEARYDTARLDACTVYRARSSVHGDSDFIRGGGSVDERIGSAHPGRHERERMRRRRTASLSRGGEPSPSQEAVRRGPERSAIAKWRSTTKREDSQPPPQRSPSGTPQSSPDSSPVDEHHSTPSVGKTPRSTVTSRSRRTGDSLISEVHRRDPVRSTRGVTC